jgi:hypothetical protein
MRALLDVDRRSPSRYDGDGARGARPLRPAPPFSPPGPAASVSFRKRASSGCNTPPSAPLARPTFPPRINNFHAVRHKKITVIWAVYELFSHTSMVRPKTKAIILIEGGGGRVGRKGGGGEGVVSGFLVFAGMRRRRGRRRTAAAARPRTVASSWRARPPNSPHPPPPFPPSPTTPCRSHLRCHMTSM